MPKQESTLLAHLGSKMFAAIIALVLAIGAFAPTGVRAAEPADLFHKAAVGSPVTVDHSAWDRLLKQYVKAGADGINRVDYAAFKASGRPQLKGYIRQLEATDPARLDRPEQFALLANLYNAKTVDIVLDHYPVASIKDISLGGSLVAAFTGGPWKAKVLHLNGVALSLDDIEHGILRPVFKDPRVHYAVNCASISCPNLQAEAFTGAKLNAQLDASAKAYVNHPRGAHVIDGTLTVSSIYSWFKQDFGGTDEGVIQHLRNYALPPLATKLRTITTISDYSYDWHLNDTKQ